MDFFIEHIGSAISIAIGLVILFIVARKHGVNRDGIGILWGYVVMIGAAFVILPIASFLDATYFPIPENKNFVDHILKESGVELTEAPSQYNDEFAENIVNRFIHSDEQQTLISDRAIPSESKAIMFDYAERGKTLSLQKYLDTRWSFEEPETKSVQVLIDRPDNIQLRHQIMIGTDMSGWTLIRKESSYPNSPFVRTYVLVQREDELKGRMVGLSFYEGSLVKIEYEGNVNEESIDQLTTITWNIAERHPGIYTSSLKEIAEGSLFEDDPVLSRPDLPNPDLDQ